MKRADLLVELRTEDLPPRQLAGLAGQLGEALRASLGSAGLADIDAPLRAYCTPRRLAAVIGGVATAVPAAKRTVRGPPLAACYAAGGKPTRALLGFLRSHGKPVSQVVKTEFGGRAHASVVLAVPRMPLASLLPAIVERAALGITAPRMMRWGDCAKRFVRPVRGILLRHGARPVKASVLGLTASGGTAGHRCLAPGEHPVPDAGRYAEVLRKIHRIEADLGRRRASIARQIDRLAARAESVAEPDAELLDEVAAMSEQPKVMLGSYADKFAALPEEVISICMKKHMRCFPLHHPGGGLSGAYLLVADNLPPRAARVVAGYDRVMAARLADALFYYRTDSARGGGELRAALRRISYHPGLGSQADRVERIAALCVALGEARDGDRAFGGIGPRRAARAAAAARLCKTDLSTMMIAEYPELEGVMAAHYADSAGGESMRRLVAGHLDASLDRAGGDKTRDCLVLACELERIAGLLIAGERLAGDSDPHGMRRSAVRVAAVLAGDARYGLRRAAATAAAAVAGTLGAARDTPAARENIAGRLEEIVVQRVRHRPVELLGLAAHPSERVLGAVFAKLQSDDGEIRLSSVGPLLAAMERFAAMPECPRLVEANKRAVNIMRKSGYAAAAPPVAADRSLMTEHAETALAKKLDKFNIWHARHGSRHLDALGRLASCATAVDKFFAEVMVNAADSVLRENRLRLVRELHLALCAKGDISQLSA